MKIQHHYTYIYSNQLINYFQGRDAYYHYILSLHPKSTTILANTSTHLILLTHPPYPSSASTDVVSDSLTRTHI